jgi:hypothetical protein
MFIKYRTLQHELVKLNDMVTNEHIQPKELEPLPIEREDFQPTKFEPVDNYLTHGSIIGTDVLVHYYHDVPGEYNNVIVRNDQNNAFTKTLINVYILEVYNSKGHAYS